MTGFAHISDRRIGDRWIKASIAGAIWAASEIVLGGFLHNLRIPFSGNLLTAIGIIILVSISHVWKEKGLFWRAGLICALMKTMSPSAVIFGPMIAIFSEGMLLEISTRLLGRTIPGYLLGAMLAMTWNLFHRIINLIIFYGMNIVELYESLLKTVQEQLGIGFSIVWLPVLFLLVLYCLFGLAAGVVGIRVGRKLRAQKAEPHSLQGKNPLPAGQKKNAGDFPYSLSWLIMDTGMIIGSLALLATTPWWIWSAAVIIIVMVWATRYKRALRQLSRPGFWVFFVILTMVTAFIWVDVPPGVSRWAQGFMIGIQMNFRAVVIILGFSVLGTELYNPRIREFFLKTWFRQLPMALELATTGLPSMIAGIPDWKVLVKNPVSVFYTMISGAEIRLEEIRRTMARKVIIVTGSPGQGKTTFVTELIEKLRKKGIEPGGIYSPRVMEGEKTVAYDVVDIARGIREPFLRRAGEGEPATIGCYVIIPRGLATGLEALKPTANRGRHIVFMDEVGRLELEGRGWGEMIRPLLDETDCHLIMSVRDAFTEQVIRKWNLEGCLLFQVSENDREALVDRILGQIW